MSNTTHPKVTIGLPVFNGESHLDRAINSLLSQTYQDFTMIICDNASNDQTPSICEKWQKKDPRVRYHRGEVNIGAAGNFSRVLSLAESPYFMWAAHDDFWHKRFIESCLSQLEQSPEYGFAMPLYGLKSLKWKIQRKAKASMLKHISSSTRSERVLTQINTHAASHICNLVYALFRTDLLKEVFHRYGISNDGLLTVTILGSAKGALVEEYLFLKQYLNLWPGSRRCRKMTFRKAQDFTYKRDQSAVLLKTAFPEFQEAIELIRSHYAPGVFLDDFRIVPTQEISRYYID